ncbi:MAG TPA: class E sortase [Actinomycetes bacterium]
MSGTRPAPHGAARATAQGIGELLITAGLVLLLFVAYQLVWTNLEAKRAQDRIADEIHDEWQRPPAGGTRVDPETEPQQVDLGEGIGFLRIPRLGERFSVPVVEGVRLKDLARGVGHYPDTVLPGEVGNFSIAGHRATNGEPFAYLDRVRPGDVIIAETRSSWFTYVVDRTRIVSPSDTWVIDPVPGKPDVTPTEPLITLTTCNPRWASTERLIVFGHLESERPRSEGPPPQLVKEA